MRLFGNGEFTPEQRRRSLPIPSFSRTLIKDIDATLQKLKNHWVHTLLSVIGIMVGVISIVILLSVSEGIKQEAINNIQDFGLNTIRIKENITQDDYHSIEAIIGDNGLVSPIIKYPKKLITFASSDFIADVYISNASFIEIENLEIKRGRKIIPYDIKAYHRVVIVSSDLSKKQHINIGSFLRIKDNLFRVIGIASIHSKMSGFIQIPSSVNPFDKKAHRLDEVSISINNKDS
ncbi:ABC transporter permease, partial [Sulfurovum sp. bin170]|uniref:ABC transporter permease n=1 Tax=Sulfurovum sp. bin170 TaxID=2695268 RepID=UPI0013DEFA57